MTKTIILSGREVSVALDGAHAHIRNDSADVIYAAKTAGITAGADGVASIPAGQAATVRSISGKVYLLGTGSVHIQSDDFVASPFKTSAQAGGSGADEVARAAIGAHEGNAVVHVTAADKAAWNAVNYSNPNLLINPDMAINQRGQAEYIAEGYAADRWYLSAKSSSTAYNFNTDGNTLTLVTSGHFVILRQFIENPSRLSESTVTFSVKLNSVPDCTWNIQIWRKTESGGSEIVGRADTNTDLAQLTITLPVIAAGEQLMCVIGLTTANSPLSIKYAKLEQGKTATNYAPADPATELAKCQRYYQIRSTGDIAAVDLRPTMCATPTVTQLSDGNYAYSAEL